MIWTRLKLSMEDTQSHRNESDIDALRGFLEGWGKYNGRRRFKMSPTVQDTVRV